MLQVSEATKEAWLSDLSKKEVYLQIALSSDTDLLEIYNDQILAESLKVNETFSTDILEYIGCNASMMEIEVAGVSQELIGHRITVYIRANETEWIPLFYGFIDSVSKGSIDEIKKITAYDLFNKLSQVNISNWYNHQIDFSVINTMQKLWDAFVTEFNIPCNVVVWDFASFELAAGDLPKVDNLTARDFIQYFCQLNGCWGKMNRIGYFETIWPVNPVNPLLNIPYYIEGVVADYTAQAYDGVIVTNSDDIDYVYSEATALERGPQHDGTCNNPYIIKANILSNNWTARKKVIAQQIYRRLYNRDFTTAFVPYEVKCMGLPFVECGDYVYIDSFPLGSVQILKREWNGIQGATDVYAKEGEEFADTSSNGGSYLSESAKTSTQIGNAGGGGDASDKMDKVNPKGTGALSLNRKANTSVGTNSVAFGKDNTATGEASTAEGYLTTAGSAYSHAEGYSTTASGLYGAHAEGQRTTASGNSSHAEGTNSIAYGVSSHAEGSGKAYTTGSHAEGYGSVGSAEYPTIAIYGHAEGYGTASGNAYAHAEGRNTLSNGQASHAEGYADGYGYIEASGKGSHAEGVGTSTLKVVASGQASHAEGTGTTASAQNTHAEGNKTTANGANAHAEGRETTAKATDSHAEGYLSQATGDVSHAEGQNTRASGHYSHAEGYGTSASGLKAHAQGESTTASAICSSASGYYTVANVENEFVVGQWNAYEGQTDVLFEVGNGTAKDARSNAFWVDLAGNAYAQNDFIVGAHKLTEKITEADAQSLIDDALVDYAKKEDIQEVSVTQILTEGTHIADITVGDTVTEIYAPEGSGSTLTEMTSEELTTIWNEVFS